MRRAYFNEIQRFRQWWVYLVIVLSIASWGYALIASINSPDTEKAMPDLSLILTGLIPLLLVLLLVYLNLYTRIRNDGIYFRFKPLQWKEKHIKPEEIERYEIRKYRPMIEYGGWGIRQGGKKYGKAYNVSGNVGLQLYLKNGKRILIGTQKPREIEKAMQVMMENKVS